MLAFLLYRSPWRIIKACRHAHPYGRRCDERTFYLTPNTYFHHILPIFRQIRLDAFFTNWMIAIHLSPKYLLLFFKGVLMIGWRRVSLSLKNLTKTGIESRYTDLKNFSLHYYFTLLRTPNTISHSLWRTKCHNRRNAFSSFLAPGHLAMNKPIPN